tara:strand:- start:24956 stop:25219 length:264 start_codon:yes stop_codon:yes gene_type:complete
MGNVQVITLEKDEYAFVGNGTDKDPVNKIYKDEWIALLEVRQDGQYNMLSPMARESSSVSIDKDTWQQMLSNFDDLYDKWGDLNECV